MNGFCFQPCHTLPNTHTLTRTHTYSGGNVVSKAKFADNKSSSQTASHRQGAGAGCTVAKVEEFLKRKLCKTLCLMFAKVFIYIKI